MADMTFMLKFVADNAKAMEAIKQMQDAAKAGESGKQATDAAKAEKSAKGAADAAKAQIKAAKETQAATKGVATEAAKAEVATRKRAEAEKAAARNAAITASNNKATAAATAAADARARAARLVELEQRRAAQAEWARTKAAESSAAQDKQRADERLAASIARRSGRGQAEILRDIQAQRELTTAVARTGQEAAKTEGRISRMGRALRGVNWARVAGNAAADLAKEVAKGVTSGVVNGLKNAASAAPGIFRGNPLMGGGGNVRAGLTGAVKGGIVSGIAANQGRETAVNKINYNLGENEADARAAIAAADAAAAATGNTVPPSEMRQAATELATGQVAATEKLLRMIADASAASGGATSVSQIAEAYARSAKEGDIGQVVAELRKGTVTSDGQGNRVLSYRQAGQDVSRTIPQGDVAATKAAMDELLATYDGAMAKFQATPAGIMAQAKAQAELALSKVMEQPFQYITGRMQAINAELATAGAGGMEAMAQRFGGQIVDGLKEAERAVISISTSVREMVGPFDSVAQSMGGWKVAAGGLVGLGVAGWLGGVAGGIKAVADASIVLAASPAGKVLAAGAATWALGETLASIGERTGNQAAAQAQMRRITSWLKGERQLGEDPPQTGPAPAARGPLQGPGPAAAAGPAVGAVATGDQAAMALATIEAVTPAATAMVSAVTGILSGANFHSHGVAMMETLAAGIRAGSAAAVSAVRETTQAMRDHLPHSPAKTGPLSDLDRIRFSETLAAAITPGPAIAAVLAVAAGMRGAIPAGLGIGLGVGAVGGAAAETPPAIAARSAGGGMSLVYSPTITLPAGARPEDFRQLLEQHKNEIAELVAGVQRRRSDLSLG